MGKITTKEFNQGFAWLKERPISTLISVFEGTPCNIYFVGGCVRDSIINEKFTDIDVAIDTPIEEVLKILENKGIKTFLTGIKFGSITCVINKTSFHITSFRRDIKTDGRHTTIEFVKDIEVDSLRRDFSINAIYYDVRNEELIDFHNGIDDLKNGVIKFIGDPEARVKEDYLRIFRYFKFYARFGSGAPLEKELNACKNNLDGITNISKERKTSEILNLLSAKKVFSALKAMNEIGLLAKLGMELPIRMEDLSNAEDRFIIINRKKNENFVISKVQRRLIDFLNVANPIELVSATETERLRLITLFSHLGMLNHTKVLNFIPKCPVDLATIQKAGFSGKSIVKTYHQVKAWCVAQMLIGNIPTKKDVIFLLEQGKKKP